ncbi:MAG TPA: ABC transporter ATP-binding protein [Actinomycetota bacterium]|nr:ABC transporter ATP-binding protein [Actinomycetota bacterium]
MSEPAVVARGLRKRYGEVEALRGIDLTVARGEIFALLGPNGAGKTTAVEILEGHRTRSSGDVSVLGMDPERGGTRLRERIGIVLQETGVDPYLTAREAVSMFRGYYPRPRETDEVLEAVGLADRADERITRLSGGQRRRLDVALALVGDPEVLFLDEPTTGFDPSARRGAWRMIRSLRSGGTTIFLTTHYMEEAQELADRAAILAGGRIVAEGKPEELTRGGDTTRIRYRGSPPPFAPQASVSGGMVEISTSDAVRDLHRLTAWALEAGEALDGLEVRPRSLEDVYLQLTGEGA